MFAFRRLFTRHGRGHLDRVCIVGPVAGPPPPFKLYHIRSDDIHGRWQEDRPRTHVGHGKPLLAQVSLHRQGSPRLLGTLKSSSVEHSSSRDHVGLDRWSCKLDGSRCLEFGRERYTTFLQNSWNGVSERLKTTYHRHNHRAYTQAVP